MVQKATSRKQDVSKGKHFHFIAIGGAAMHNLAIALHNKGYIITGSDDEIAEPSKTNLKINGLLPSPIGWFPEKITPDIDTVILGMHARADNPELLRAQELGIKIYSYPEYLYEFSKDKKRVVIGGSHGKTTITAMVLHVLKHNHVNFDFMVGAKLEGFDNTVKLSSDAPVIVLEGDEYLSSPIDRRPKFHLYKADIGLISGIAWDHINVFPTYDNYVEQFRIFANTIPASGTLIYCDQDKEVKKVVDESTSKCKKIPYGIPWHQILNDITYLEPQPKKKIPLHVFGEHNLMNVEGARNICNALGINDERFYSAISSFKGAARRLELLGRTDSTVIYKDFAHSPSKLKATIEAVKKQYAGKEVVACMELHTFSSLNDSFLNEYKGSMDRADEAIVYFNPHTIEHKKLKPITTGQVKKAFARESIITFTDAEAMKDFLIDKDWKNKVLLLMTSGTFDGMDMNELVKLILKQSIVAPK